MSLKKIPSNSLKVLLYCYRKLFFKFQFDNNTLWALGGVVMGGNYRNKNLDDPDHDFKLKRPDLGHDAIGFVLF